MSPDLSPVRRAYTYTEAFAALEPHMSGETMAALRRREARLLLTYMLNPELWGVDGQYVPPAAPLAVPSPPPEPLPRHLQWSSVGLWAGTVDPRSRITP